MANNALGTYGYFKRNTDDRVYSEPLIGSISSNQSSGSRGTNGITVCKKKSTFKLLLLFLVLSERVN